MIKADESDVDLKSEVRRPRTMTILKQIAQYCEKILKLTNSAETLNNFIYNYLRLMFSYNRGSRNEIKDIMESMGIQLKEEDINPIQGGLRKGL